VFLRDSETMVCDVKAAVLRNFAALEQHSLEALVEQ
jgi:hypothetical protein